MIKERSLRRLPTKVVSITIIILAISIVIAAGVLSYFSTQQIAKTSQLAVKVTWHDSVGDPINSATLISQSATDRTKSVSFTCSSSIATVSLELSSNIGTVKLSQSTFSSCGSSADHLDISIPATSSLTATGTLQVVQSDQYTALSGQLTLSVRPS